MKNILRKTGSATLVTLSIAMLLLIGGFFGLTRSRQK